MSNREQHRADFEQFAAELAWWPDMRRSGDDYKCALTQHLWIGFLAGKGVYP